ncbi:hypothetical protein V5799_033402 [Amblyomma americanum]|uniref:Uncharacterized protein n=1 Tax=Amblyomma americanum TaxID=6943 RepID=A0AAQ4DNE9_AMBAM
MEEPGPSSSFADPADVGAAVCAAVGSDVFWKGDLTKETPLGSCILRVPHASQGEVAETEENGDRRTLCPPGDSPVFEHNFRSPWSCARSQSQA